jgi:hemerythrin-like domain-containing protein
MAAKFETEQAALEMELSALEAELAEQESQAANADKFLDVVRRHTEIETLTPAVVHEFIDRIIIHEPEQARKNRRQKVTEINFQNQGIVVEYNLWKRR